MHHEVVFAPEADDQLEELLLYIAEQASADVAERFVAAVVPLARAWSSSRSAALLGMTSGPGCA